MVDDGVMEDGVALESAPHPQDPATIERLCRAVCKVHGLPADMEAEGLGMLMPRGMRYRLWEAQRAVVTAVLDELAVIDSELQLNPASLETAEIAVDGLKPGEMIEVRAGETMRDALRRAVAGRRPEVGKP